jgi:hypothetical protein
VRHAVKLESWQKACSTRGTFDGSGGFQLARYVANRVTLARKGDFKMAKFGLFKTGAVVPSNEYEGDYMKQTGEYVTIFRRSTNPSLLDDQVAAIRLDKGQSVKEMTGTARGI